MITGGRFGENEIRRIWSEINICSMLASDCSAMDSVDY